MRSPRATNRSRLVVLALVLAGSTPSVALAQDRGRPPAESDPETGEGEATAVETGEQETREAESREGEAGEEPEPSPGSAEASGLDLPEGMTLDEVLERAAQPPPQHFPDAVDDDSVQAFLLADQFEYRWDGKSDPDVFGWEADAWIGGDFNRLWFKPKGEATFHSPGSFESETDILYSRLVFPFWSAQIGARYANEWMSGGDYVDRWSGALAFQGLAPAKFEVDASAYVSEGADVFAELEIEYDWRITQRLVAQPRTELVFAFQDVPEQNLGAGLTIIEAGIRLRYEIKREFAPYLGFRYEGWVFGSAERRRAASEPTARFFGLAGLRFALL